MYVLGIDTALDACSVALLKGNEVVFDKFTPLAKGHAETIAVLVHQALSDTGLRVADLCRVGVVVGPGGFAGARAGLAFAQGLAIGVDGLDLIGVDSFRALRESHHAGADDASVAVAIDARRGQVYLAAFDRHGQETLKGRAVAIDEADSILRTHSDDDCRLIGNGAYLIVECAPNWRVVPDSNFISAASVAHLAAAATPPFRAASPVYLRAPDAKKSAASLFAALLAENK